MFVPLHGEAKLSWTSDARVKGRNENQCTHGALPLFLAIERGDWYRSDTEALLAKIQRGLLAGVGCEWHEFLPSATN